MKLTKLLLWMIGIHCILIQASYAQGSIIVKGYAQEPVTVKGSVKDKNNVPLSGATITEVKKQGRSTASDANGNFEIKTTLNARLKISMIGYKEMEVLAASSQLNIQLEADVKSLEETVVIGYVAQKKELLTGSVGQVKLKQADVEIPTTSAGNLLAGKIAGLNVGTPNGLPGSQPGISIRTGSSLNGAPVLYVIDGKISGSGDFNNLSPNEISEITVLKDAATTAAYGSRAAGGVIVVTTKRGSSGKATFNYTYNSGRDVRGKNMDLTNILQWGTVYNNINGLNGQWSPDDSVYYATHDFGGGKGYGFNLLKDVYRDASTSTHNLSVSGGSDKVRYFIGGSFVNAQTFVQNTAFKKYNLRANITADVTKDISVFASIGLNDNLTSAPRATLDGDFYSKSLVWQPFYPSFTANGLPFDFGWITNVAGEMQGLSGYNKSENIKPTLNLSATYKMPFLKGLSAKASFAKSYTSYQQKLFSHPFMRYQLKQITPAHWDQDSIVGSSLTQNTPQLEQYASWSQDKQLDLQLNYDHSFGKHHVSGTLVYESFEAQSAGVDAWINGYPLYTTDQWWATTGASIVNNVATHGVSNSYGVDNKSGRRSWVGQFFYDYASKYLLNFTYRYDGSMNFSPDNRWGVFPSASAGWIISKEKFFEHVKGINMLKLRASAGLTGNDNIGGYQWQDSYRNGSNAFFGASPALNPGLQYSTLPNPDITWEKYFNKDIGIDINFLNHWNASIEYWHHLTYDILGARIGTTPPTFSRSLPAVNYGKMKAQGIDLMVGYTNRIGNVNINASAVASYGYAWRTEIDQNVTYDYQNRLIDGRAESYVVGYVVDHMIRTQADLDAWNKAHPTYSFNGAKADIGQFVYKDLGSKNGVGVADSIIDNNDVTVLRKRNNPVVVGLNLAAEWKGLSISANFNGSLGYSRFYTDLAGGVEWNRMWEPWATNAWSPQTPNGWLPRRYSANDGGHNWINSQSSDFWLADASFLRLKTLNIAYLIPQKLYSKYVSSVRVYASGSNLFIISGFNKKFYDPETGSGTAFPIVRSYNMGVSVTF